ncbi:MAG TPA: hypothetical protein VGE66_15140 [Chitinophagaceae bacterium]
MDKQNKDQQPHRDRLEEQQAPLKNTDHAFVQVGRDGEPVIPQRSDDEDNKHDNLRDGDSVTTIKHR